MPQTHASARPVIPQRLEDGRQQMHLRSLLSRFPQYRPAGRFAQNGGQADPATLDDARFLSGYLRYGIAKVLFMVVIHRGDHGQLRSRQDIGGVEASAYAHFYDRDSRLFAREPQESHTGQQFKKAQVRPGLENFPEQRGEVSFAHLPAVYLYALRKVHQVRADEQAGLITRGPEHRVKNRADRALAVGAGDMHRPDPLVRIPQLAEGG